MNRATRSLWQPSLWQLARNVGQVVLLLLAAASCGGGRIDPGFFGEIQVEPERTAEQARRIRAVDFERPKLVIIRAAWCGACDAADPSIQAAFRKYQARIDLVVLDVTDEATTRHAARMAEAEGVSEFFGTYQGRTPTLGLFESAEQARVVHASLLDPSQLQREFEASLERFAARKPARDALNAAP